MTERVKTAEKLIVELSSEELSQFSAWFVEFQHGIWDKQIEEDSNAGRLDKVVQQTDADIEAGRFRKL